MKANHAVQAALNKWGEPILSHLSHGNGGKDANADPGQIGG